MENCKSILIVEDDTAIREEVVAILEDEGYKVTATVHGREAFDFLKNCPKDELPGCVILDLMMPVMTGVEFLNELITHNDTLLLAIPVVVATAKGSPTRDLKDLPSTIARIRKPFDLDELLDMIEKHCGQAMRG